MKKLLLSLLSIAVIATTAKAQVAIAPEAGLNMSNMTFKPSIGSSPKMKIGATVGAVVDLGLSDNLFIQPGLFFMMNGCKFSSPDATISVNTIQIPVNLVYKLGKPGGNRLFFGVGPYLGYNVGAKMKTSAGTTTIDIGSDSTDGIKAMDLGLGLHAGYMLSNNLFFRVRYQMGLSNMMPKGDANNSIKSSAIGVTVGYYFGGKKAKKGNDMKKK